MFSKIISTISGLFAKDTNKGKKPHTGKGKKHKPRNNRKGKGRSHNAKGRDGVRDPHRAREAKKYDNPIPSREVILDVMTKNGAPISFDRLAEQLDLSSEDQLEALNRRTRAMCRDGQALRNRRGGFCVVNHEDLIPGRVVGHPDGFGFLKQEEGGDDLFLGPKQMQQLWHGDRVLAHVSGVDRRGRSEGHVVEVLERALDRIVGRIYFESNVPFLRPDNKRIVHRVLINPEQLQGAEEDQVVVAQITEHPTKWRQPVADVVEILGDHMGPGMETKVAIYAHDIPYEWPQEVENEISGLSPEVQEEAKQGREDLRDIPLVTIDGADARDFDDAVYCNPTENGWRLIVAIADVSSYVIACTALDDEAYNRATSVYFPDQVVPMLPEVLSNGLCSLNPKVDRLCMTAELHFDHEGIMTSSRFFEAVMNSHARLTYDQVGAMLTDGDEALCEEFADVLPHLNDLNGLYKVLSAARTKRGAIDFDTTETRFEFNDNGKVAAVVPVVRHDAHKIIEECMLAANVAAAKQLLKHKMPAMYRIHEKPSEQKLSDLRKFLKEQTMVSEVSDEPTALEYSAVLKEAQERPDFSVIQMVLLRSMMQAVYSVENVGHFGLSFDAYAHFTSPIRRYPDLMVHRALKHIAAGGKSETFVYTHNKLAMMAEHCSANERRANDASRDSDDTLKCEFMLDKVGGDFPGIINGVNSFGVFVELDEIFISGLVHITALDYDYFHFDPVSHSLTGERTGKVYRLGDPIVIRVAAVNLDERKIDFMLEGADTEAKKRPPKSDKKRNKRKPRHKGRDDNTGGSENDDS